MAANTKDIINNKKLIIKKAGWLNTIAELIMTNKLIPTIINNITLSKLNSVDLVTFMLAMAFGSSINTCS